MKILITGGAGFIGSHLCEKLVKSGNRVIAIDNFDPYYDPKIKKANIKGLMDDPRFTLAKFDIRDSKKVNDLFKKHKPDHVIHLAALAGVRSSIERAGEYVDVNIGGTINVMDAARRIGTKNFVLASTSSVYGATDKIPFKEDQLSDRPLAPYPASKKGAELMAHAYHNMFGMNINVLRLFTAYGPRVRPDMMSFMVIDRIARGRQITLFDNAKMQRDWTYIGDVCSGILSAVRKNLGFEVMNIGRGKPVKLLEFIKTIEKLVGKKAKLKIIPTPASEPTITYASILKANRLLNYRPSVSIKQGLEKTWEWYRERKI